MNLVSANKHNFYSPNGTYVDSSNSHGSDNDNDTCTSCEPNTKMCVFNNSTKNIDSLVW